MRARASHGHTRVPGYPRVLGYPRGVFGVQFAPPRHLRILFCKPMITLFHLPHTKHTLNSEGFVILEPIFNVCSSASRRFCEKQQSPLTSNEIAFVVAFKYDRQKTPETNTGYLGTLQNNGYPGTLPNNGYPSTRLTEWHFTRRMWYNRIQASRYVGYPILVLIGSRTHLYTEEYSRIFLLAANRTY